MKLLGDIKQLLKPNKKTIGLGIILILLLSLVAEAIFTPHLLNAQISYIENYANTIKRVKPWEEGSQVYINLENDSLVFTFNIAKKDQPLLDDFLAEANLSDQVLTGVRIEMDSESAKKLAEFLPLHLSLTVSGKKLSFYTPGFKGLESSLIKKKEEYATGSSKLQMIMAGDKQFKFDVKDPEPLLAQATASGQISLSSKLIPLFPIISKVDTIRLDINGNYIEGDLKLKD